MNAPDSFTWDKGVTDARVHAFVQAVCAPDARFVRLADLLVTPAGGALCTWPCALSTHGLVSSTASEAVAEAEALAAQDAEVWVGALSELHRQTTDRVRVQGVVRAIGLAADALHLLIDARRSSHLELDVPPRAVAYHRHATEAIGWAAIEWHRAVFLAPTPRPPAPPLRLDPERLTRPRTGVFARVPATHPLDSEGWRLWDAEARVPDDNTTDRMIDVARLDGPSLETWLRAQPHDRAVVVAAALLGHNLGSPFGRAGGE